MDGSGNLKAPVVLDHTTVHAHGDSTSYITTFEVFLMQKVDHLNRIVVTVAHLNKLVAGQESCGKKK